MSFLFPYTNSGGPKQTLSSKFKVASQSKLKKISNTYWQKQFSKKGIKMKGEDGDLTYVNAQGVRSKISELLRKRGYLTDKTLERDLTKERVRAQDRTKVAEALRQKFAEKVAGTLTPEQIQANVKRARAVSRLMSTKGRSAADNIKHGRDVKDIKEKFKSDYSSLDVHGQEYSVGISASKQSADDARYQKDGKKAGQAATSINDTSKIKSLTGENKGISSGNQNENKIATGIGLKQGATTKESAGKTPLKKTGGGSGTAFTFSPTPRNILDKKRAENNLENNRGQVSGPIIDTEFQGGVIFRGKKVMHFSNSARNSTPVSKNEKLTRGNSDEKDMSKNSKNNTLELNI